MIAAHWQEIIVMKMIGYFSDSLTLLQHGRSLFLQQSGSWFAKINTMNQIERSWYLTVNMIADLNIASSVWLWWYVTSWYCDNYFPNCNSIDIFSQTSLFPKTVTPKPYLFLYVFVNSHFHLSKYCRMDFKYAIIFNVFVPKTGL